MRELDIKALADAWEVLTKLVGTLKFIETDQEHERCEQVLDALLDASAAGTSNSLDALIGLLGDLIRSYENERFAEERSTPAEVLRLLMQANGLKQTDLAEEVGGQSVVSEILSGKREVNARQASKLAARFGVSPALFVPRVSKPKLAETYLTRPGISVVEAKQSQANVAGAIGMLGRASQTHIAGRVWRRARSSRATSSHLARISVSTEQ